MKTITIILSLVLLLAGTAQAQTTRPIANPHGKTVFAYANEITPSYFDGIGTVQLYIIDTDGNRWKYFPRPKLPEHEAKMATATQAQIDEARREHEFDVRANKEYAAKGMAGFKEYLEACEEVAEVKVVCNYEAVVIYKDGEEVSVSFCGDGGVKEGETIPSPQEFWMQRFQKMLNLGANIYFGTSSHGSMSSRADPDRIEAFREAIRRLKRGEELTPEQLNTPAGYDHGIQYDATH